ncbi:MAG: glycosyltransferase family 9 protein [Syntrophus sp. (in: bacteria)]|nr:glycosyltransferase family 9 protein [Syntrophus sp. (in: bacteria)]
MKPETIRKIDIGVGKIACLTLTCLRRVLDRINPPDQNPAPVKKILFIKLIEQGATVLAYSAILRAIDKVGRQNVYFCVFEENREILDIIGVLPRENVFVIRNRQFSLFLLDILRSLYRIRRIGIDATIDMEFFARASAILSYLTGAARRVGLHRFTSEAPYRGDIMTHRVHYNPYLHTAKAYHLLVAALDAAPEDLPLVKLPVKEFAEKAPTFVPGEQETEKVRRILEQAFPQPVVGPIVLLNPNASDMLPLRKWDTQNFIRLGRRVLQEIPKSVVIITGAPSERESAEMVCREIGSDRAVCLAGKTTLRELLVLYTLADVLVTNDSGPGHFASMTDIHSVVLYGPETPRLFGAIGGSSHIIHAGLACSPCVNVFNHRFSPCRNNRCMQSITVEQVYDTVRHCLKPQDDAR